MRRGIPCTPVCGCKLPIPKTPVYLAFLWTSLLPTRLQTVLTSRFSLVEASLIIITGTLPTMRLFLRHVAPRWITDTENTQTAPTNRSREPGWELQHQGTHDPYELEEDGSSERVMFPNKDDGSSSKH